ncbi:uncharacterized protein LOC120714062 [Simochromis diagramma]|uniref:uncharacterized protein LOC120714062 n=1 Tax=Simochromis diagramma TaxID=43689 RepID=UPI001A7ED47C|nr:uncharacterized protein LOC120714062 [Simochromis diagramma]
MEASKGIYKPIRVLFNTPIYNTAVEICWYLPGYRAQIAMMTEFLRLQKENQMPSSLTAEDMGDLLVERSKETVREQLWEFELEGLEETEAKPLLKLVWAVNTINKMRDIEFQARMLLEFPEAIPPKFQTPKLLSNVRKYIDLLKERQQDAQTSKLFTATDVVIEVVPRVLHGFWKLPSYPLLNMSSQKLSILSTSVTKATLDRVSKSLLTTENQAIFSRSIRDDMVQSILSEVREKYSEKILLSHIANFAPGLLRAISDVAKTSICQIFQPPCESPVVSDVLPTKEPHPEGLLKSDVLPTSQPPVESSRIADIFSTHEPSSKSSTKADVLPAKESAHENLLMSDVVPTKEPKGPDRERVLKSDVLPTKEPQEPACESVLKSGVLPTKEPHEPAPERVLKSDVLLTSEPPFESSTKADVLPTKEPACKNLLKPDVVPPKEPQEPAWESVLKSDVLPTSEPLFESSTMADILPTGEPARGSLPKSDVHPTKEPLIESSSKADVLPTKEPASESLATSDDLPSEELPSVCLSMSEPVVSFTNNSEKSDNIKIKEKKEKKKKKKGFFQKFRALFCCCFRPQETD